MDFQVRNCWRYDFSSSFVDVVRNVNYSFMDSGSSSVAGILNYERIDYSTELVAAVTESFVAWDNVTTSSMESWIKTSYGDNWGSFTSSIASTLTDALNARTGSYPSYNLAWQSGSTTLDTSAVESGSSFWGSY